MLGIRKRLVAVFRDGCDSGRFFGGGWWRRGSLGVGGVFILILARDGAGFRGFLVFRDSHGTKV